jgi:Protein of unknown function (DUF3617)
MRKTLALAVICLAGVAAFAAVGRGAQTQSHKPEQAASATQTKAKAALLPLNVSTGLWEMTQTVTWTGLPPQFAAALTNGMPMHYKSCVKQADLIKNPWANGSGAGDRCSWTVLSSTGTDMQVQGTCSPGNGDGMSMQMHGKIHAIDSENGTGSVDVTLTGNGMNAKGHATYTGKWIAATCPADVN